MGVTSDDSAKGNAAAPPCPGRTRRPSLQVIGTRNLDPKADDGHGGAGWSYNQQGGDWSKDVMDKKATGMFQSPIDISTMAVRRIAEEEKEQNGIAFMYNYSPKRYMVTHSPGRSVKVSECPSAGAHPCLGRVIVDDVIYRAVEFHFHSPGEHTFDGPSNRRHLEMHVVHVFDSYVLGPTVDQIAIGETSTAKVRRPRRRSVVDPEGLNLKPEEEMVVVAFTFDPCPNDKAENTFLQSLIEVDGIPPVEGQAEELAVGNISTDSPLFDMRTLIDDNADFFRYFGSLTTPPCCEVVHWFVATAPQLALSSQLEAFRKVLQYADCQGNFRQVVPTDAAIPQTPPNDLARRFTATAPPVILNKCPDIEAPHNDSIVERPLARVSSRKYDSSPDLCALSTNATLVGEADAERGNSENQHSDTKSKDIQKQ